jgi:hypothetical protein
MDVLSIGGSTALFSPERAAYPGGIAGKPGRDIRADLEGDQEVESRTCSSTVAMSRSGRPPASSRGTGRGPRSRLRCRRDSEIESILAVGGSRRGSDVGMLEFGHGSQVQGFADCPILPLFGQRIFDVGSACRVEQRCLMLSHSPRVRAYGSRTSVPRGSSPTGRSN